MQPVTLNTSNIPKTPNNNVTKSQAAIKQVTTKIRDLVAIYKFNVELNRDTKSNFMMGLLTLIQNKRNTLSALI